MARAPRHGRFDQGAIDIRTRRIQVLTEHETGEPLVDENGPIPPLFQSSARRPACPETLFRRLGRQLSVKRSVAAQNNLDPPRQICRRPPNWPAIDAEEAGQNGFLLTMPQMPGNIGDRLLG